MNLIIVGVPESLWFSSFELFYQHEGHVGPFLGLFPAIEGARVRLNNTNKYMDLVLRSTGKAIARIRMDDETGDLVVSNFSARYDKFKICVQSPAWTPIN